MFSEDSRTTFKMPKAANSITKLLIGLSNSLKDSKRSITVQELLLHSKPPQHKLLPQSKQEPQISLPNLKIHASRMWLLF